MDNEYWGKTYVIHFLKSKDRLRTSVIKLGYPQTFVSTVQKKERKEKKKKERSIWLMNTGERPMSSTS